MASLPQFNVCRAGDFAIRTCSPVRAIVFAGTGGGISRVEGRSDPGSEEVLVGGRFAGVNTYMACSAKFGKVLLAF